MSYLIYLNLFDIYLYVLVLSEKQRLKIQTYKNESKLTRPHLSNRYKFIEQFNIYIYI